ncbi:RAB3A interacting protein isoform alpha 2-like protein [Camelus ferus]|nr:RAB3A interacting protein isoform alpha 2-like protein [Camelus ferus]
MCPDNSTEYVFVGTWLTEQDTVQKNNQSKFKKQSSYDEAFAMANDPLEGFHEVNLASPTSPDLLGVYEPGTQEQTTSPSVIYRPHPSALCPAPIQANTLDVSDLPTQPVYSSPRRLNCAEISGISIHVTDPAPCSTSGVTAGLTKFTTRKDNCKAEREFLQGATVTEACESSDDIFGLSTDSLSRLRSPSVLEVREKGYERLKEELAKAQREAHKMVREANVKQATAEKQLKEAQGKIDVLQAEVAALKTLVLSTSPTSPTQEPLPGGKAHFKKGHTRNKSTSSAMSGSHQDLSVIQPIVKDCKELASAVLEAVENNTLSIEPVGLQPIRFVKASAVECGGPNREDCTYFLKSDKPGSWRKRYQDHGTMDVVGENEALQQFFEVLPVSMVYLLQYGQSQVTNMKTLWSREESCTSCHELAPAPCCSSFHFPDRTSRAPDQGCTAFKAPRSADSSSLMDPVRGSFAWHPSAAVKSLR